MDASFFSAIVYIPRYNIDFAHDAFYYKGAATAIVVAEYTNVYNGS